MPEIISRKEAKERGLKTYFTGVTCNNGHFGERYVRCGRCCLCSKTYYDTRSADPDYREKRRQYQRKWAEKNRSYQAEYRRLNPFKNKQKYAEANNARKRKSRLALRALEELGIEF